MICAINLRLYDTDSITAARRPNGNLCLSFAGTFEVEIPPELAADLFAGLLATMKPSGGVVLLHPKADAVRALFAGLPSDSQPKNEKA